MRRKFRQLAAIAVLGAIGFGTVLFAKPVKQPDSYAYNRGVECFNNDNLQDAYDWFQKEASENPDNGYANLYIGLINYNNDKYGEALMAIDKALKKIPKKDLEWRVSAFNNRAMVNLALEDTVSALGDFSQAVKTDPKNTQSFMARAELYYQMKNYDLSDQDYRRVAEVEPGNLLGSLGQARNASARKNWDESIKLLDKAIKLDGTVSKPYSFRAEAYAGLEKWNEATDDLIKALDIDGDNKAFDMMTKLPDEPTILLKTKLKVMMAKQPTNLYWPYCLGVLASSKENYDEAIPYFQQANSLDANSVFLEQISDCYQEKGDLVKALDYIEQAQAMNSEDTDLITKRAVILASLDRYDEAIKEIDRYVASYPDFGIAYIYRAEMLMEDRQYEKAAEDYTTAFVVLPLLKDGPAFPMKRGDAYRLSGKTAEAAADYNLIIEQEKDSLPGHRVCTPFALSGLGQKEKAIEEMRAVVETDTADRKGNLYNLACIFARTGNNSQAVATLRECVDSLGYDDLHHIKVDYDLDPLREMPEFQELLSRLAEKKQQAVVDTVEEVSEAVYERVEVPFTKEGGVTKVKCAINGLPLHFVFDTGAADVTLSMVEANFMLKNDYITPDDFIGSARYIDANGDISEGSVINLKKVDFGGLELENVRASVVRNQKAPLLLGQSVLGRLGKIEIDNPGLKLVISHRVNK